MGVCVRIDADTVQGGNHSRHLKCSTGKRANISFSHFQRTLGYDGDHIGLCRCDGLVFFGGTVNLPIPGNILRIPPNFEDNMCSYHIHDSISN